MFPPAPTRLSTTTCWPSVSLSCDDMERAITSVAPPGPALTTSRIDFAGQACACANEANAYAQTATRHWASGCIGLTPWNGSGGQRFAVSRYLARPRKPNSIEVRMGKNAPQAVAQRAQTMRLSHDHGVQRQRKYQRLARALLDH